MCKFVDELCTFSCVKLQFVIKMIDKKSFDFIFVAPKLKINKMVGSLRNILVYRVGQIK